MEITERLALDPASVFVPDGSSPDPKRAATDYEAAIAAADGIDIQLLGIGHNGRLAFNEPGSDLESRTRVELFTERKRQANARYFDSSADVPERCITQGLGTILEASQLLLVVHGADKALRTRARRRSWIALPPVPPGSAGLRWRRWGSGRWLSGRAGHYKLGSDAERTITSMRQPPPLT